jgi:uncharacterized membrane protein
VAPNIKKMKRWLAVHRRQRLHWGLTVALIILLLWFLGNVISPYLVPAGTVDLGNTGIVGIDHEEEISQINSGFAKFFYTMGDANCHQRATRSLFLNDNQMPFCTRCTAIFLGLVIGIVIVLFLEMELNFLWIMLGLVPVGVDGLLQLVTDYESPNPIRFGTGLLAGIVTAIALGFIITEMGYIIKHRKSKGRSSEESPESPSTDTLRSDENADP